MASSSVIAISSAPESITLEQHRQLTASTPTSFDEIPPILRLSKESVSIEFDPPVEHLSLEDLKKGTLHLTEQVLAFTSSSSGKGFKVLYPSITIHAVSRSGERPMVYCQIEKQQEPGAPEDDENIDVVELKIYPSDAAQIDDIFESLSYCASLHPDPNMMEEGDDEAFYRGDFEPFNGEDGEELSEVGRAALEHLESIIVYPPGVPRPAEAFETPSESEKDATPAVNGH